MCVFHHDRNQRRFFPVRIGTTATIQIELLGVQAELVLPEATAEGPPPALDSTRRRQSTPQFPSWGRTRPDHGRLTISIVPLASCGPEFPAHVRCADATRWDASSVLESRRCKPIERCSAYYASSRLDPTHLVSSPQCSREGNCRRRTEHRWPPCGADLGRSSRHREFAPSLPWSTRSRPYSAAPASHRQSAFRSCGLCCPGPRKKMTAGFVHNRHGFPEQSGSWCRRCRTRVQTNVRSRPCSYRVATRATPQHRRQSTA